MKPRLSKPTSDPAYFAYNHVQGGSFLTIENETGADLTVEVTNQDVQRIGVGSATWSTPANGAAVIADGDNFTIQGPYAFVRFSGTGTGNIYLAYTEKDGGADEFDANQFTLFANFANEQYKINGSNVTFDDAFDFSRPSSKWVFGGGAQTGQLVEVPAGEEAIQHDPITGEALGVLVEGGATNYFTGNDDPSTFLDYVASPFYSNTTRSNLPSSIIGVNGLRLTAVSNGSVSASNATDIGATGSDYIVQVIVEPKTATSITLNTSRTGGGASVAQIDFDPSDGSYTLSGVAVDGGAIEIAGGRWLLWVARNPVASNSGSNHYLVRADGLLTGESVDFFAFDAVRNSVKPSSHINTNGSQVTRAADLLNSNPLNFNEWYNPSGGVLKITAQASDIGVTIATLGSLSIVSDSTEMKEYTLVYGSDPSATELDLTPIGGSVIIQKVTYV